MDVVALYPSIRKDMAKKAVKTAIEKANASIKYLSRVVALVSEWKEIKDNSLEEVVPKPKARATLKSYMEPRDTAKATNGDTQFVGQVRQPNEVEPKMMIGFLAAKGVEEVVSNH